MKRLIRCVYGRNSTVSFLIDVRSSAASVGSLFWMNEFGNQVYAWTTCPIFENVYGAVYVDCDVHVASVGWNTEPFSHACSVMFPRYAAYEPPCGWYCPWRPRYSSVIDELSLKR